MNNEQYQEYLCSREWGLRREAVTQRSGGICERCRINKADAVHHKTYKRVYNELLTDLIHLCGACHAFQHGRSNVDPTKIDLEPVRVYMAGKVVLTKGEKTCPFIDCWRDDIFFSTSKHGGPQELGTQDRLSGRFLYGGPIIEDGGGHRLASGEEHSLSGHGSRAEFCLEQLKQCDVVFAWLNGKEALGTLTEIGLARAFEIPVFIVFSTKKLSDYFYFAGGLADKFVIAPSAIEGWELFVNWCETENRSWWKRVLKSA